MLTWKLPKTPLKYLLKQRSRNAARFAEGSTYEGKKWAQYKRKSRYGLSHDQFLKLLEEQDNRCQLCGCEFSEKLIPHVDHDHETKKVRGLLCHSCNRGLGLLKDSMEIMKKAVAYLSK